MAYPCLQCVFVCVYNYFFIYFSQLLVYAANSLSCTFFITNDSLVSICNLFMFIDSAPFIVIYVFNIVVVVNMNNYVCLPTARNGVCGVFRTVACICWDCTLENHSFVCQRDPPPGCWWLLCGCTLSSSPRVIAVT